MLPLAQLKLLGYCALGLLVAGLIVALSLERRHSRKLSERNAYLVSELQRITTAKDEQRKTSERTVREVIEGPERVRTIVRTIREAPNPEGCATPSLDVLRNEV